jgi:hypothetical protein
MCGTRPARSTGPAATGVGSVRTIRPTTELRQHGLDDVQAVLGHSKVEATQLYAEKDLAAAMALVARIG